MANNKITVAELKKKEGGALGQVISGGINRYVVVEETAGGAKIVCLYGTVMGDPDEVLEVPNAAELFLDDKEYWKKEFYKRWLVLAERFPAIGK